MKDSILEKMRRNSDTENDIVCCYQATKSRKKGFKKVKFCNLDTSKSFHIYTRKYIYFLGTYDGEIWVESIPRDPSLTVTPTMVGG